MKFLPKTVMRSLNYIVKISNNNYRTKLVSPIRFLISFHKLKLWYQDCKLNPSFRTIFPNWCIES